MGGGPESVDGGFRGPVNWIGSQSLRAGSRHRAAMRPPLPEHRRERQHDDDEDDLVDVLGDLELRAQEPASERVEHVAEQEHADDPADAADDVVEEERAVLHLRRAGDDRHERPDDRDEPGDDDRLAAVLLVEGLRLQQVRLA